MLLPRKRKLPPYMVCCHHIWFTYLVSRDFPFVVIFQFSKWPSRCVCLQFPQQKKTSVIFFFYFKKFKVLFILFPHLFSNRETLQCSCCWIQKLPKVHLGHSICLPQGRIQRLASIAWDTVRFSEN